MVVLVTGSAGFLGGSIVSLLRRSGSEVAVAGRPEIEIPSGAFEDLVRTTQPEVVVHCAGPASVKHSFDDPLADFSGSAGVLAAVLDLLRSVEADTRLLVLSSAAIYGEPERLPVNEEARLAPVSPYGFHRRICEQLLREHYELYGLRSATLRIFSAYGEGLRRQLLWDICSRAIELGKVELFGDGSESRDFIHASDVAEAVRVVIESGSFECTPYNVGSGFETTVEEISTLLRAALELPADAIWFNGVQRAGDPKHWRADVSRMQALGFAPRVGIDSGVVAYGRWARQELAAHAAVTR